jgi:predicted nucleotidyltransferase
MPERKKPGISEIVGEKRAQLLALATKHGAYNVRVFGSVAVFV